MDSLSRIRACKLYLRRRYVNDIGGLRILADKIAGGAFDPTVFTSSSFEGGSGTAQVVFEPLEYLTAAEELIAELDPDYQQGHRSLMVYGDYSGARARN